VGRCEVSWIKERGIKMSVLDDQEKEVLKITLDLVITPHENAQAIIIVFNDRNGDATYLGYGCLACVSKAVHAWLSRYGTDVHNTEHNEDSKEKTITN